MKIAFLNIYQNQVNRGLETYVYELSERLKKKHEVDIYTGKSEEIRRWPILWRTFLDPHGVKIALFTLRLIPSLWKKKYDIIFPLNGGWQVAFIRILTWAYGGKMIISGQSGRGWDERNNIWSFPDIFVSLTKSGEEWIKKVNPFVRTIVIPNGVDTNRYSEKGIRYPFKLEKPVVICQGAAESSKRLDLTIKAVSQLRDVSLLIVGKGSLSGDIKKLGMESLGNRFKMIDVTQDKMPEVYRAGNVFTLVSLSTEAFGIAYLEAMATNLPVVATDDKTRHEIVGDAGLFVDPMNIQEYSAAIKKALSQKWGNKPRLQAEKFGWDRIADKYEDLFNVMFKKSKGSARRMN